MVAEPEAFGRRLMAVLSQEHGEERWREVLRLDGQVWLDLAASASAASASAASASAASASVASGSAGSALAPGDDLYDSGLSQLEPPAMLIHGGRDPRTEPGEFAALVQALPGAVLDYHPDAGHSPHSEAASARAVTAAAFAFLEKSTR